MRSLSWRVAVVTGAASGIGRALAGRCAAEGMKVVLADVEAAPLQEAAGRLEKDGAETLAVVTDVASAESVDALARRSVEAFGAVHLVCNNAGVFAGGSVWDMPLADFEWVVGVNVFGVLHGIRSFVPILLEQGGEGHIVNTASMAAVTATPYNGPYTMSKHAVLSLSETLFLELRARRAEIGVSVLCPELVATGIGDSARNRPASLARSGPSHAERDLVEKALRAGVQTGIPPERIADRALEAVRNDRFYVLCPEEDPWRDACNARLDDIRHARNPGGVFPGREDP
jgi:NAD(P)-dependent dehydrogenase (short-subunit alcohol dehydrogenase family)